MRFFIDSGEIIFLKNIFSADTTRTPMSSIVFGSKLITLGYKSTKTFLMLLDIETCDINHYSEYSTGFLISQNL